MDTTPDDALREIVSSRVLPFPREQVFRALSDPERLARWWGPSGFTNTFEHFDFRPGGEWKFIMHGPDGKDYPNRSVFRQIEAPARLVLRHDCAPYFTMDMNLAQEGEGTRLHWRMLFDDAKTREAVAPVCVPANEQNFDRLHAELSTHR